MDELKDLTLDLHTCRDPFQQANYFCGNGECRLVHQIQIMNSLWEVLHIFRFWYLWWWQHPGTLSPRNKRQEDHRWIQHVGATPNMISHTSPPPASCKNYGILLWTCTDCGITKAHFGKSQGNFHAGLWSLRQHEPGNTFDAGVALSFVLFFCCVPIQKEKGASMRQRKGENNKDGRGLSVGRFAAQQQDGKPTSASINNLYELLRPEGVPQLWAIPQLWQLLISCTFFTHTRMDASIWNIISSLRLCWSAAIKGFSFFFFFL